MKLSGQEESVGVQVQNLLWEGEPVLVFTRPKIRLPIGAPKRVERYYHRLELMWKERWEKTLYRRACAAAQAARSSSRPFEPWSAALISEVMEEEGLLHIRWRAEEQAKGRCHSLGREESWQLPGGMPVLPPKGSGKKCRKKKFI